MKLAGAQASEDTVGLTFSCPKCGGSFAMLTNPSETSLVKGLGVQVGGRSEPAPLMEVIQASVERDAEGQIAWDQGAETRLGNVPPFARPMARKAIERFAASKGIRVITPAVMDEARALM